MTTTIAFLGAALLAVLFLTAFLVWVAFNTMKDASEAEVRSLRDLLAAERTNCEALIGAARIGERTAAVGMWARIEKLLEGNAAERAANREREIEVLDRCLQGYSAREHLNLESQRLLNEAQHAANEAMRNGVPPVAPRANDRASQEAYAKLMDEARAMGFPTGDEPGLGE